MPPGGAVHCESARVTIHRRPTHNAATVYITKTFFFSVLKDKTRPEWLLQEWLSTSFSPSSSSSQTVYRPPLPRSDHVSPFSQFGLSKHWLLNWNPSVWMLGVTLWRGVSVHTGRSTVPELHNWRRVCMCARESVCVWLPSHCFFFLSISISLHDLIDKIKLLKH